MARSQFLVRIVFTLSMWLIALPGLAYSMGEVEEKAAHPLPAEVLEGVRTFLTNTALPDGSFRPGMDPAYKGYSDTGYSDLAAITYAVCLARTFGWKLPHESNTLELLLSRQQDDGAFVNIGGSADPRSSQARLYNTTQALVALHALGAKPKRDPLPVFAAILKEDYKKLPLYTTSFFPLAYQAAGKPFPATEDRKIRALMIQDRDGMCATISPTRFTSFITTGS